MDNHGQQSEISTWVHCIYPRYPLTNWAARAAPELFAVGERLFGTEVDEVGIVTEYT